MVSRKAVAERTLGVGLLLVALAVCPFTIKLLSGFGDLPVRVTVTSGLIFAFFLSLGSAALVRGHIRQLLFICVALTAPFAILAMLELGALRVHLANRIMLIEDY